jgi:hypothetical protein
MLGDERPGLLGLAVRLATITLGQTSLGLVPWLVEQGIGLGPALLGSWFYAVESMANTVLSDGAQEVLVIGVRIQGFPRRPEASLLNNPG